jgi:hypothetical protein
MPLAGTLPSGFADCVDVLVMKTRGTLAALPQTVCFLRFPPRKYHSIHNFRRNTGAIGVLHSETTRNRPEAFDAAPPNHR